MVEGSKGIPIHPKAKSNFLTCNSALAYGGRMRTDPALPHSTKELRESQ